MIAAATAAGRPEDPSAAFAWALVLRLARAHEPPAATFLEQRTRHADAAFVLAALGLRVAGLLETPARFLYSTPGLSCVLLPRSPGAGEIADAQRLVATEYPMLGEVGIACADTLADGSCARPATRKSSPSTRREYAEQPVDVEPAPDISAEQRLMKPFR